MTIKSGIFAGILALIVAFMSEIPIYPPENWVISFRILAFDNIEIFFWGYLIDGIIPVTTVWGYIPEALISVCLWLIIFFIGLSSILASTTKAKVNNSLKLFKINILLLSIILIVFGIIIFFLLLEDIVSFFNVIGFGYYFIIVILILNIIALKNLKKE